MTNHFQLYPTVQILSLAFAVTLNVAHNYQSSYLQHPCNPCCCLGLITRVVSAATGILRIRCVLVSFDHTKCLLSFMLLSSLLLPSLLVCLKLLLNCRSHSQSNSEEDVPVTRLAAGDIDGVLSHITEDFNQRAYFITGLQTVLACEAQH